MKHFSPATPIAKAAAVDAQHFADVIASLRAPAGCPWDREQTHRSLVPYLIEESYELVDAIDSGDPVAVCEELGDVLLQVVLHAQLAAEAGDFTLQDVVDGIDAKIVRRHPHVFGEEAAADAESVRRSWQKARAAEGRSVLGGIPVSLPGLALAERVAGKAAGVGFDWPDNAAVVDKIREEVDELDEAVGQGDPGRISDELGDVLFAAVSLASRAGISAEAALRSTVARFRARFEHVEQSLLREGLSFADCDAAELDRRWNEAKAATARQIDTVR
jgi:MazG family protein